MNEKDLRKRLRKVIGLTSYTDPNDGSVWGFDTKVDSIDDLLDEAVKIMKEKKKVKG